MKLYCIPSYSDFNENIIKSYIGTRAFVSGAKAVACGDVSELKFSPPNVYTAFVHSTTVSNEFYETMVEFDVDTHNFESKCACTTGSKRCQHQSTLLHLLLALKNYASDALRPKWGKRVGMSRFKTPIMRKLIRADLTWQQALVESKKPAPQLEGLCFFVVMSCVHCFDKKKY
jgi:hypothetical protein